MRRPDRRTAGMLAIVAAAFVVLGLAASGPAVRVWTEPAPTPGTPASRSPSAPRDTWDITMPEPRGDGGSGDWLVDAEVVVGVALALSIIALIVATARRWRPRAPRRRRAVTFPPFLPAQPGDVELDVEAQLTALASGSPRNAIVACWLQMEDDVSDAGLPRRPAETSTEYTTRVLGAAAIVPAPVRELAALYREARFSRHELTDEHRARALAALRAIHADLELRRAELSARGAT